MRVTVDMPGLPKADVEAGVEAGTIEVPGFGVLENGNTYEADDEQVQMFKDFGGFVLEGAEEIILDGVTEHPPLPEYEEVEEVVEPEVDPGHQPVEGSVEFVPVAAAPHGEPPVDPVEEEDTDADKEDEV